jgi:glycine/D-amino acid oxidase-like deaminating enzyme
MSVQPYRITINTPITHQAILPSEVDIVIIGGGVIGVSTAWFLAQSGLQVLLCEKGRIAGEQSSRNWGWVRQQGRDLAELPIMMESMKIWQQWSNTYGDGLGFSQQGIMYQAENAAEMAEFEQWYNNAKAYGIDTVLLSTKGISEHMPSAAKKWHGGMLTPSDARAEPWQAIPTMAYAAVESGAEIIENCAVRGLEHSNSQITAVHTEQGTVKCSQVLLCGGAWSSLFLQNMGIKIPQLTVRSTVAQTTPCTDVYTGNAVDAELAIRRRQDGGYTLSLSDRQTHYIGTDSWRHCFKFLPVLTSSWKHMQLKIGTPKGFPSNISTAKSWSAADISPFEITRILEPTPEEGAKETMLQRLVERFPELAEVKINDIWAGMIDATPDAVPIVDKVPNYNGLWLATGFSGHGFGIGPAMGRILADQLQHKNPIHDMQRFRFSRFSDGSKLIIGPKI